MSARGRLALIGLGTWAATGHLPVYRGRHLRDHVEVVALCSRDQDRARDWADHYGVAGAYADVGAMLTEVRPDVVTVCTPDHAHTPFVLAALEAGCDVLVEKPLATDLDEARSIVQLARSTGRRVIPLFHKRADPLWTEAASRVASSHLGPLQMGMAVLQNPVRVPAGGYFASDLAAHSDSNWFLGTHVYDLLRFITGLDPTHVRAHRYEGSLTGQGIPTADAFKADIVFEGGASVSVLTAWNLPDAGPALTQQSMMLHFRDGQLDLDGTRRGFIEHERDGYRFHNPYFLHEMHGEPGGYGPSFLEDALLDLFGVMPAVVALPTLEDAWWATAVADAVSRAAASGETVDVVAPPEVRA